MLSVFLAVILVYRLKWVWQVNETNWRESSDPKAWKQHVDSENCIRSCHSAYSPTCTAEINSGRACSELEGHCKYTTKCGKETSGWATQYGARSHSGWVSIATATQRGDRLGPSQVMWDLWCTKWHWDRFPPSTSVSPANPSTSRISST
jgi:hypothetical protein